MNNLGSTGEHLLPAAERSTKKLPEDFFRQPKNLRGGGARGGTVVLNDWNIGQAEGVACGPLGLSDSRARQRMLSFPHGAVSMSVTGFAWCSASLAPPPDLSKNGYRSSLRR